MARNNKNYPKNRDKNKRKRSKYTEQEKLAYRYGQVKRGLKNPESLISISYQNGLKEKEVKPRRSLY